MDGETLVLGHGPVGRAVTAQLAQAGQAVRVAQRRAPGTLPPGVGFTPCDVLDAAAVRAAIGQARQVVLAIGFAYTAATWRQSWPVAMQGVLDACAGAGARLVFVDNLYMYGPQTAPLREDMPLTGMGGKPGVRAAITRQWQAAQAAGRVRVAALRAPDFYGPGVGLSHLGDLAFGALARGRRALLLAPPDRPHDVAYVPDIGRGVLSLLAAPDADFGQAWHIPCAPLRTPRQILALGAKAIGVAPRITAIPPWSWPVLGLAMPMLREMGEMRFQWDRPYRVDAQRFAQRFWGDATPFEEGAPAAARSFRPG